MLRVLLIDQGMNTGDNDSTRVGGGQIARRRFLSDKRMFEVTVLTSEKDLAALWQGAATIVFEPALQTYRPTRAAIGANRVNWIRLFREGRRASRLLVPYLSDNGYDVIFFNDNKSRMLYLLSRFFRDSRKISARTAVQVDGEWGMSLFDTIMKTLYLIFFDRIICPTEAARKRLGFFRHLVTRKLLTAYPGVDLPEHSGGSRRPDTAVQQDKIIIFGCIGTLNIAVKGQDLVIDAVERLVQKHGKFPVEIRFFGDGPDRHRLEAEIRERKLDDYFRFEGFVNDQAKIYNTIDACIVASRTEVASVVIMECVARNIPVISADLDSCREILAPFYDTLFFHRGNAASLAAVIDKVLEEGALERIRDRLESSDKRLISRAYQAGRVFDFLRSA